jgi:uncharacterized membrane protein YcaP (DUF421 family)
MLDLLDNNYVRIIGSTLTVYVFIIVAIRLFGKKELAQLSVVDLVFILLISNSVQNAMVGPDATLLGGLVAAVTLFLANYLLKYLQYRFPKFGKIVQGDAIMLIYEGKYLESHLKKARITKEEIMEAVREHGVSTIEEVNLAIMEVDGSISVLSGKFQKKTTKKRRVRKNISNN